MFLKVTVTFFFFAFFNSSRGDIFNPTSFSVEESEEIALEKWKLLDKNIKSMVESAFEKLLPVMMRSTPDLELSPDCTSSLLRIMIGLRQLKEFPLKLIDASAKIQSGIFSGAIGDYGHYDQCLDLVEIDDITKEKKLQGQYCLVEIRPSLPPQKSKLRLGKQIQLFENFTTDNYVLQNLLKYAGASYYGGIILGVCTPSACSKNDLEKVIAHAATVSAMHGMVLSCEIKETQVIDQLQYVVIGIMGLIVLLSALGTVITAFQSYCKQDTAPDKKKKSMFSQFFTSFSFEKNVQQLLKVEANGSQDLECIHGIRFFSMTWVILGHVYLVRAAGDKKNAMAIKTILTDPVVQPIANTTICMEVFFCIGGLVASYTMLKASDSQKKFIKYLPLIIFRRIWRLLPSMLLLTGAQILFPLIDSGPQWKNVMLRGTRECQQTWFLNILFVSNFFDNYCLPHLWYLSIDMQLYFVGIILMILFYWKKKWSYATAIFLIISSITITSALTYWKDFFPIIGAYTLDLMEMRMQQKWIYLNPITHLASYCIGLTTGTIIARKKTVKLHFLLVAACWCASTALALTAVYYPVKWVRGGSYNSAELLLFSGFYRPVFAISVAWVIFACVNGYGGVVNRFLSWTGFVPLSRLTFLVYLWHPMVIMYWFLRARDGTYSEHHVAITFFISHLVLSYATAFVVNSVFDGPLNNLTKILLGPLNKGLKKEKENFNSPAKPSEDMTTFSNNGNFKLNQEAVNEMTDGSYVKRL